jgi:hypothetical protein
MDAMNQMIVSDLAPNEVKQLMERYEFQIRDSLRTVRSAPTFVQAKIALKAANVARAKLAFLMEHAA